MDAETRALVELKLARRDRERARREGLASAFADGWLSFFLLRVSCSCLPGCMKRQSQEETNKPETRE
jgi:hypothetical protein